MAILPKEKQIIQITRRQVTRLFREILSDPDAGLVLNTKASQSLRKSLESKKESRLKNLLDVLKRS